MKYKPNPVDTNDVVLPESIINLREEIARQVHEVWALSRVNEGWTYGEERDSIKKTTPCLIPYEELPEIEKDYDRNTAEATLKLLIKLGYKITK